jgi:hypothetical protein
MVRSNPLESPPLEVAVKSMMFTLMRSESTNTARDVDAIVEGANRVAMSAGV